MTLVLFYGLRKKFILVNSTAQVSNFDACYCWHLNIITDIAFWFKACYICIRQWYSNTFHLPIICIQYAASYDDNISYNKILNSSAKFGYSIISTIMKEIFQSAITIYPLIKYAYVVLLTTICQLLELCYDIRCCNYYNGDIPHNDS